MSSIAAARRLVCAPPAFLLALVAAGAGAQEFPAKPIRLLIGVAPGGATEILARAVGIRMAENIRQQVVVDSRPGANHIIAGEITAKAPPDGYTLQMIPEGFVINKSIYAKLPFDPVKDFTPISFVAQVPNVLVVHPSMPVQDVKGFIALVRSRPGQLSYGSSGVGSPSHMSAELFKVLAKVDFTHIPYKGSGLSMIDLIGGHLHHSFPTIPASNAYIRSGRLRALGVTTTTRAAALPEVPTIREAGVPGYEVSGWYGIIGPIGIPRPVVERLHKEVNAVLNVPEVREQLSKQGAEVRIGTPADYGSAMEADMHKWAKVVASAGIKPQR